MTVAGRSPLRKAAMADAISAAGRPARPGTGPLPAGAWQPEQAVAPGGAGSGALWAAWGLAAQRAARRASPPRIRRRWRVVATDATAHTSEWFFSGNWRMRLPVAAKMALSTAGAATAIVGSPTPPQKPPEGMTMVSTAGMSAMRITS